MYIYRKRISERLSGSIIYLAAMKILSVFFLTGLALASAVPVSSHDLTLENAEELETLLYTLEAEDDNSGSDLGRKLRERLDEILAKIKDAVEQGKTVREDYVEKLREVRGKLKEMKEDIGKKAKELLEQIKEKGRDYLKKILERLGLDKTTRDLHAEAVFAEGKVTREEREKSLRVHFDDLLEKLKIDIKDVEAVRESSFDRVQVLSKMRDRILDYMGEHLKNMLDETEEELEKELKKNNERTLLVGKIERENRGVNFRELFERLKEKILKDFDVKKLKDKVESVFGKGSEIAEMLINRFKGKGDKVKQKILDFIDRMLEDQEEKRSIKDVYEKVKNYFKDLQIELKEKFLKFGEWAKEKYEKGLEKGKDRVENLKKLAKEFINDAKTLGKDVAEQAKDFFEEYKEDLGVVYKDLKEKINEIIKG